MPATQTISYDPALGTLYARTYALYAHVPIDQRLFFYDAQGNDCANFASQCIWAAYGGWRPGLGPAEIADNRKRIRSNFRQTAEWYGSQTSAGSNRWRRVEELFAYLVASKNKGPKGSMIMKGGWNQIDPQAIHQGDLVQLVVSGYADYRFGHSLYVTQAGPTFDEILICCHSYDRLDAPLSSFARYPDAYPTVRVIRLHNGVFSA